jgi:hypothetical protein
MKDLLGNNLLSGDIIILGTRDAAKGYSSLKAGIVIKPSVKWGKYECVLIHSLNPLYLKYEKQNPAHVYRGAKPESIIKVAPETFSKAVLGALRAVYVKYHTRKIKVRDMDRTELEERIKRDVERI